MNKLITLCLSIMLCGSISSQMYYGFNYSHDTPNGHINNTFSKYRFDPFNMSLAKMKSRYSTIELLTGYQISKRISVETGARWNHSQSYVTHEFSSVNIGGYIIGSGLVQDIELKYLTVPVLLSIHHKKKDGMMYFKIGPQFSYLRKATCMEAHAGGIYDFNNTSLHTGSFSNSDLQTEALGYTFRDKFKIIYPEIAVRMGATFLMGKAMAFDLGYSFESSLTNIEDKNATDNLGRKLGRFTDMSETVEGPRAATIIRKSYFYCGLFYFIKYDKNGYL